MAEAPGRTRPDGRAGPTACGSHRAQLREIVNDLAGRVTGSSLPVLPECCRWVGNLGGEPIVQCGDEGVVRRAVVPRAVLHVGLCRERTGTETVRATQCGTGRTMTMI
jgi:hypothetical protein